MQRSGSVACMDSLLTLLDCVCDACSWRPAPARGRASLCRRVPVTPNLSAKPSAPGRPGLHERRAPSARAMRLQRRQGEAIGQAHRQVHSSGIVPAAGSVDPFAQRPHDELECTGSAETGAPGAVIGPGCEPLDPLSMPQWWLRLKPACCWSGTTGTTWNTPNSTNAGALQPSARVRRGENYNELHFHGVSVHSGSTFLKPLWLLGFAPAWGGITSP